jgi:hypothetical protein
MAASGIDGGDEHIGAASLAVCGVFEPPHPAASAAPSKIRSRAFMVAL